QGWLLGLTADRMTTLRLQLSGYPAFEIYHRRIGIMKTSITRATAIVLLLWGADSAAQSQTPYEGCVDHLAVAQTDNMLAFQTCFYSVLAELTSAISETTEAIRDARQQYANLARVDGDYYMIAASSCDAERTARVQLEGSAVNLSAAMTRMGDLIETFARFPGSADQLMVWALSNVMVEQAAPLVTTLNEGLDTTELAQFAVSSQETLTDIRNTDVENRCGSADPLPDDASNPPFGSDTPSTSSGTAGFTGTQSDTEFGTRFDDLAFNGVAVSACRSEANCGNGASVAREVCHRMGFSDQAGSSMASHGDVETIDIWTERRNPSGSSVLRMVVCR
ncbi:MAG: hypothetical protein KC561_20670, partial [Myxococcales bacterium]|nr:hypothetical protein [Myxococcales bacterium]